MYKEGFIPISYKLFKKNIIRGNTSQLTLWDQYYQMPEPDKDSTKQQTNKNHKKKLQNNIFINKNANVLKKYSQI